jgi:hypothetical protein
LDEDVEDEPPDDPDVDVLCDEADELPLDLSLFPVADCTVFTADEVIFATESLPEASACAAPTANPRRRNPSISPTTTPTRRATHSSVRPGGRAAPSAWVNDGPVAMAMRSPPKVHLRRMMLPRRAR